MPLLTVFTPTYNRSHTLGRTYHSLQTQTSSNFVWLIIDDGSTDDTKRLVDQWKSEDNKFEIRYCYKENGGLHTGYNKAIELCDTELMVCIDSDDYMPNNAVQLIEETWETRDNQEVGGIIGLDYFESGKPVGNMLPDVNVLDLVEVCFGRIDVHGDKKQVMRTDLMKMVAPMPSFEGEKNFNPYYLILKMAQGYKFLVLNQCLCVVDYQNDGMTANQYKQYLNSPNSFAETRRLMLSLKNGPAKFYLKQTIHYCSISQLAHNRNYIKESPKPLLTVLCTPAGWLLTAYIRRKAKL